MDEGRKAYTCQRLPPIRWSQRQPLYDGIRWMGAALCIDDTGIVIINGLCCDSGLSMLQACIHPSLSDICVVNVGVSVANTRMDVGLTRTVEVVGYVAAGPLLVVRGFLSVGLRAQWAYTSQ